MDVTGKCTFAKLIWNRFIAQGTCNFNHHLSLVINGECPHCSTWPFVLVMSLIPWGMRVGMRRRHCLMWRTLPPPGPCCPSLSGPQPSAPQCWIQPGSPNLQAHYVLLQRKETLLNSQILIKTETLLSEVS